MCAMLERAETDGDGKYTCHCTVWRGSVQDARYCINLQYLSHAETAPRDLYFRYETVTACTYHLKHIKN
jgi:hypothetical protein